MYNCNNNCIICVCIIVIIVVKYNMCMYNCNCILRLSFHYNIEYSINNTGYIGSTIFQC